MRYPLNKIIKEACVETLDQAIASEKKGAHRIELCGRLDLGGITPDEQLIKDCIDQLSIPIKVMIRPRGGNFIYSKSEIDSMLRDIEMCNRLEIPEFVFGALTEDRQVDMEVMSSLSANVGDAPITFHKAIDEVSDLQKAIANLKKIPQIKYILSSGLAATAEDGKKQLVEMLQLCGESIKVIVAGKVTNQNIENLHAYINAEEYHGTKIVGPLSI